MTPLHTAALWNNTDAVHALLAEGANVNDTRDDGYTPLMVASSENCIDAVSALIAVGADVNHLGFNGATAVVLAAIKDHLKVVSALAAAGADLNYVYEYGRDNVMTVLELAESYNAPCVVAFLQAAGARRFNWAEALCEILGANDGRIDKTKTTEEESATLAKTEDLKGVSRNYCGWCPMVALCICMAILVQFAM
jgi:ankyrin repeat protein